MRGDRRRQWTAEEKLQILDEARKTGQAVSEVCRRHQIAPGQFYQWEQQVRKAALEALRNGKGVAGRPQALVDSIVPRNHRRSPGG